MTERTCSIDGCTRTVHARGLCNAHYCRNKRCVRPSHLEAVTPSENMRRIPFRCGHPRSEENSYRNPSNPQWSTCRMCMLAKARVRNAARRVKGGAGRG